MGKVKWNVIILMQKKTMDFIQLSSYRIWNSEIAREPVAVAV